MGLIRVGTAGWSIPSAAAAQFAGQGTHLDRYARRLDAAEINTSFYRPHRRATYARWAASVPADFRFSVKLPRCITHERRLQGGDDLLARFAGEVAGLGDRLGAILVQLPPSLAMSDAVVGAIAAMRSRFAAPIVCEPRHASWFTQEAEARLTVGGIARVFADPPARGGAASFGGAGDLAYLRLHGSPRVYWSGYDGNALARWVDVARDAARRGAETWVIFDNTAAGAAIGDALNLARLLDEPALSPGGRRGSPPAP